MPRFTKLRRLFLPALVGLCVLAGSTAGAHDDDKKPKTPSKALGELKKARTAMDALKKRLTQEGKFACCMQKPIGATVEGCDLCIARNGSCACAANLAQGKGVCGECYGAWKQGKGSRAFGKVDVSTLKVLSSEKQAVGESKPPADAPEYVAYLDAIVKAKRILVAEQRFSCCIGKGGCDECAHETYCGCGANLAKDMAAKPGEPKAGICAQCLDGQHAGIGRLGAVDLAALTLSAMDDGMMTGALGPYSIMREGSGTTWIPESSPMYSRMGASGRYRTMQMGMAFAAYSDTGGLRGERQFYLPTQYMYQALRETGGGTLSLRGMVSLDPLLVGKQGYPNLFQTGETYLGQPLRDRQHPHDLLMELAVSYAKPLSKEARAFLYFAPAGEPALGPAAFQHRPSAWDNPVSPITHHWFDGTHITYGVATAGVILRDRWKLEGSIFTGREPNEHRYDLDAMRFDSYSGRVTYNPSRDWSFQTSYGFLRQPEALEPGNQHRLTLSAHHNKAYANGDNLALTLAYGRNIKPDGATPAWLFEAAYLRKRWVFFSRYENVVKDELVNVPDGRYTIQKFTLGATYNFQQNRQVEQGIGASMDWHNYPAALNATYGSGAASFNVFYRLRFGRM